MNEQPTPAAAPAAAPTPAAAPAPAVGPFVPEQWPGAFGLLDYSKRTVMNNLQAFIILTVVGLVLSAVFNKATGIVFLIGLALNFILSTASVLASIQAVEGKKINLQELAPIALKNTLKFTGISLIMGIAAMLGILLLIVPGLFIMTRWALAPYFLLEQNMGISEALSASWVQMKGNGGKLWGIIGVTLVFVLACVILIGIYFLFMYSAAMTILYFYVKKHYVAAPSASAVPAAPAAS